ncbi:MAG: class I SAM-dependent methyltransferase [Acidobacteriota bacterium]
MSQEKRVTIFSRLGIPFLLATLAAGAGLYLTTAGTTSTVPETQELVLSFVRSYTLETALHNTTAKSVSYTVKPDVSLNPPESRVLGSGLIDRFKGTTRLEVRLLVPDVQESPGETGRLYYLQPGEEYLIRQLDVGPRVFRKVKGYDDALKLAPYVASPMSVVNKMLELAGVDEESIVYDLGCGDGRVVIAAARDYGARGVGVDIDPELIQLAWAGAKKEGVESRVRFLEQDILQTDLSEATVVYLYLFPDSNRLLRPFLEKNLTKGTLVASSSFKMYGWEDRLIKTEEVVDESGIWQILYLYLF